ncbi:ATP-grasp domain-containing protein [Billgrantia tianxiuensis]|jgi:biotin carboxylase|uniref:ATP-grasp domain-containing protein n=1 Tax=Billgrantia tianxiuensis TaxID=2497861 RepID=A0A6I6SEU6_9GAMM|nr:MULTISPECIES: ATP-grasp domain-containing protein [Halomonas]MCE8033432.1 ATP-grasp domain-containing protein [Halomonas sp. MCCC 1A11057]QHC49148.1 ATP-grasp domain-containing protein [Halomonas tianxiuensis]
MKRNIFVVALEDQQRQELETLRHSDKFNVHSLLSVKTAVESPNFSFDALLNEARRKLEAFDGSIDAIVAQWDFPTSVMVPILCREYDIPSPSVESVLKCEHKYWSRLEQQKVIPEVVPEFCGVDPFAEDPLSQVTLKYPFWIKPVKAFSSHLGFKIENDEQFHAAIEEIRQGIRQLGDPFNEALNHVELPSEIQRMDGNSCIAEQIVSGVQGAPEGTVYRGEFNVHGIIAQPNSVNKEIPFDRLEYPSNLPERIHREMIDMSHRFLEHIGYDNGCFNAEFMWDEESDKLWLIEFNTRISQSHSEIFIMVDGMSNHEVAVDIAFGERPSLANRQGEAAVAAKCYIPYEHRDGIVRRVPSEEEIAALAERFPGTKVRLDVQPGDRLGDLMHQDSFSYRLGTLYVAGEDHDQIEERYKACLEALQFEIEPTE